MAFRRERRIAKALGGATLLAASFALSACLSSKVSSLAPNMARLNLQGFEAPSEQEAFRKLMVLAAEETLARDYTLFRFIDWDAGPTQLATPGRPASANFAVTVVMFRDGEQGSNPVFNAREILRTQEP